MTNQLNLWDNTEHPPESHRIDVQPSPWHQAQEAWGLRVGDTVRLRNGDSGIIQGLDKENKKVLVIDDFGLGRGRWYDPFGVDLDFNLADTQEAK